MEWQLKNAPASKGVVTPRVLAQGSIPVLLSATGCYCEFVSSTGETSYQHPHVEVSLAEAMSHGSQGSDCWVDHVYIYAVGSLQNGRQQTLPVVSYQKCQPARTEEEIQSLIDSLGPRIAEAVTLCGQLDAVFQEAANRTAIISQLQDSCTTRGGYEAACATANVEPLADTEIVTSYGISYGEFSFPEYSTDVVLKMALARYRKQTLDAEAKALAELSNDRAPMLSAVVPVRSGQLWEPCRCGKEPVYMPLHLCDSCWPKEL